MPGEDKCLKERKTRRLKPLAPFGCHNAFTRESRLQICRLCPLYFLAVFETIDYYRITRRPGLKQKKGNLIFPRISIGMK